MGGVSLWEGEDLKYERVICARYSVSVVNGVPTKNVLGGYRVGSRQTRFLLRPTSSDLVFIMRLRSTEFVRVRNVRTLFLKHNEV